MFPCLTSHICGAITSCHHPDGLLPQCHLSFSDAWWDPRFHPGTHHFLIKWRSYHKLLSTMTILGTILIYSILNFHSIWNTWDISAPPWLHGFIKVWLWIVSVQALDVHWYIWRYLKWNSCHFQFWSWTQLSYVKIANKSKMDNKGKPKSLLWLPLNQIMVLLYFTSSYGCLRHSVSCREQ